MNHTIALFLNLSEFPTSWNLIQLIIFIDMLDTSQGDCPHVFLDVNANLHLHVFSHAGSIFRMALIKSKWFLPVSSAISSDVMCWLSFPTCVVFFIEIIVVFIVFWFFARRRSDSLAIYSRTSSSLQLMVHTIVSLQALPAFFLQGNPCYFFCRASPAGDCAGWRLRVTIIPNPFLFLKKGLQPTPGPLPF